MSLRRHSRRLATLVALLVASGLVTLKTERVLSSGARAVPPPGGCTGANFMQPVGSPVGAGTTPASVAVGDFNLDGKPDLAVANFLSANVTVLLGNGSGFGAAINFNPNAETSAGAFSQGHNLHKLRLTTAASVTIPVFPPSC